MTSSVEVILTAPCATTQDISTAPTSISELTQTQSTSSWDLEEKDGRATWTRRKGTMISCTYERRSRVTTTDNRCHVLIPSRLCSNYDLSHPDVRQDLLNWGDWIADQLPLAGIRLDAAKHISQGFMRDWLAHMDLTRPNWFYVGEYCSSNLEVLTSYIRRMDHRLSLFDFPLHSTLVRISWDSDADLRNMLDGSLTSVMPANAVVRCSPIHRHITSDAARPS